MSKTQETALKTEKLEECMHQNGYECVTTFMEYCMFGGGIPNGICMEPGCDYTTEVEPDCEDGWCEVCQTNTVKAAQELFIELYP